MDLKWMKPDFYTFDLYNFINNIENILESSQIGKYFYVNSL